MKLLRASRSSRSRCSHIPQNAAADRRDGTSGGDPDSAEMQSEEKCVGRTVNIRKKRLDLGKQMEEKNTTNRLSQLGHE